MSWAIFMAVWIILMAFNKPGWAIIPAILAILAAFHIV